MSKKAKLIDCKGDVSNPKLIRLNCLMLASIREECTDVIRQADNYYWYVKTGEYRNDLQKLP